MPTTRFSSARPVVAGFLCLQVLAACSDDGPTDDDPAALDGGEAADIGPGSDLGFAHDGGEVDGSEDAGTEDGGTSGPTPEELEMLLPSGQPTIEDHVNIELTVEQLDRPVVVVDLSEPSRSRNQATAFSTNGSLEIDIPVPNGGDNRYEMSLSFLPARLQIPGLHPMYEFPRASVIATDEAPVVASFARRNTFESVGGGASTGEGAIRFDNCPTEVVDDVGNPGVPSTSANRLEITLGSAEFGTGESKITVSGFISVPMAFGDGSFCQ